MPLDAPTSRFTAAPRRATRASRVRVGSGEGAVMVGGGAPDRRAVHDQHRHGRRRGDGAAGRRAGARRLGDGAHHGRPRRGRRRRAAYPRAAGAAWASTCRSSATSTTSATSCSTDHPACAEALDKYRINPGNVGFKDKKDRQFGAIVEKAIEHGKAVRIGANWGSLDQELLTAPDGRECQLGRAHRRARRDPRGDGALGALLRRTRRGDRPAARPHHPVGQGLGGAGPHRRLPHAGGALRLRPASRPDRGRHGLEGHRRLVGRARHAAAGRASATRSASR